VRIYWNPGWWSKEEKSGNIEYDQTRTAPCEISVTESRLSDNPLENSRNPGCVILAAGASTRLRPWTDSRPKCLLTVQGKTILERTMENILVAGVNEIAVVTGYRASMIRDFLKRRFPTHRVRFIFNPHYAQTGNAYSLLLARQFVEDRVGKFSNKILLLDSDIMFSGKLLPYFLASGAENKIAVRISGEHNVEEIQVGLKPDGRIHFIGKKPDLLESPSESIGIELFSAAAVADLFAILERRVRSGVGRTEFYEASFQEMIDGRMVLKAVDVSAFPAIEIDTPEDLEQAGRMNVDE